MKSKIVNFRTVTICVLVVCLLLTVLFGILFSEIVIAFADEAQPTLEELAESYTRSDEFSFGGGTKTIQDYKNSLTNLTIGLYGVNNNYNYVTNTYTITGDDPIVNIIPKNYFYTVGKHCYIGKQYGFFVDTVAETYGNKTSVVLLFDITPNVDYLNNNSNIQFIVQPLFERRYTYALAGNSSLTLYTPSGTAQSVFLSYNISNNYVVPTFTKENTSILYRESEMYSIGDVCFASNMFNINNFNLQDGVVAYKPQQDKGAFFVNGDAFYSGAIIKRPTTGESVDFFIDVLYGWCLDAIPGAGIVGDLFSFTTGDAVEIATFFTPKHEQVGHTPSGSDFPATRDEQITNYDNLIKTVYCLCRNDEDNTTYFYSPDHYVTGSFKISNTSPNEPDWYTALENQITLNIYKRSDGTLVKKSLGSRHRYRIGQQQTEVLGFDTEKQYYVLAGEEQNFVFTPQHTGYYNVNLSNGENVTTLLNNTVVTQDTELKLNAGTQYNIKIKASESATSYGNISVSPKVLDNTSQISLESGEEQIVKLGIIGATIKNAALTNSNCKFLSIKKNSNQVLVDDVTFTTATNEFGNLFTSNPYYAVLKNFADNVVTTSISFTDPTTISDNSMVHVTTASKFYKFVAPAANCSIVFEDAKFNSNGANIYSATNLSLCDLEIKANGVLLVYGVTKNNFYYVKVCDNGNGSLGQNIVSISDLGVAFSWNVIEYLSNGSQQISNLNSNRFLLSQSSSLKVQLKIGDVVVCENFTIHGNRGKVDCIWDVNTNILNYKRNTLLVGEEVTLTPNPFELFGNNAPEQMIEACPEFKVYPYMTYRPLVSWENNGNDLKSLIFNANDLVETIKINVKRYMPYNTPVEELVISNKSISCSNSSNTNRVFEYSTGSNFPVYKIEITKMFVENFAVVAYDSDFNSTYYSTTFIATTDMFDGGNGSSSNPYLIRTATNLANIRHIAGYQNAHYLQTASINMRAEYSVNPLKDTTFKGEYNGNKKFISVQYETNGQYLGGLFKTNQGAIRKAYVFIHLLKSTSTKAVVGGLVAVNKGILADCKALITVTNTDQIVATAQKEAGCAIGGFVGINESSGKIRNCWATLNINGKINIGGIAGINKGQITKCTYNETLTMQITAATYVSGYNSVGFIAGRNTSTGTISGSTIYSAHIVAGTIGFLMGATGKVAGVYENTSGVAIDNRYNTTNCSIERSISVLISTNSTGATDYSG